MTKENLTIKPEKKSSLFGGKGGGEFDDLDKIASILNKNKEELLNNGIIKDIHIEKIKISHADYINAIQFSYKVITSSDKSYSIEGNKHGGDGGKEIIINLENDEYILNISGRCGRLVDQLNFSTYIPSKKQIKTYGPYGGDGGSPFDLPACACFFGRSGVELDALGIYEAKVFSSHDKNEEQWKAKFQELSDLLFPNQSYDFAELQREIIRLKYKELAPQVRTEKAKFEQLVTEAKVKAGEGSFSPVIDFLLETHQQMEQANENSQKDKLSGKIEAYQNVLEGSLSKEELQNILNKRTELYQLEKHLESLQINEQVIQILPKSSS